MQTFSQFLGRTEGWSTLDDGRAPAEASLNSGDEMLVAADNEHTNTRARARHDAGRRGPGAVVREPHDSAILFLMATSPSGEGIIVSITSLPEKKMV
jgi:hypothetical protein